MKFQKQKPLSHYEKLNNKLRKEMKSPKQKSLGQIAYETFCLEEFYRWDLVKIQDPIAFKQWTAVGRAVSTAVRARQKRKK